LYVDDERPIVKAATRTLGCLGYVVTGFAEPSEALRTFVAHPHDFDVVVTDLWMPSMSGFDFAREVLRVRPDVPVLMLSGYVRPEDRETARSIGVRELMGKPHTEQLGRALANLFEAPSDSGSDPAGE
jgi:CheY-like chemotaxis protein